MTNGTRLLASCLWFSILGACSGGGETHGDRKDIEDAAVRLPDGDVATLDGGACLAPCFIEVEPLPSYSPSEPAQPCTAEESADRPIDTNDDIYGVDGCLPTVSRFVVLGDSIADCFGVDLAQCAPYLIADALRSKFAPQLAFEEHAFGGAEVADLLPQAQEVAGGSGHVLVWIYAIGNDWLSGAPFSGDFSPYVSGYQDVFDYFTDSTRFPDGATFLLNTQYTIFDECHAPGASDPLTPDQEDTFIQGNRTIFLDVAETRTDTVAVDQYPDFLGHALNANVSGCPYCGADNTTWLADRSHPNVLGHAHIAEKWILALDRMTALCAPDLSDAGQP